MKNNTPLITAESIKERFAQQPPHTDGLEDDPFAADALEGLEIIGSPEKSEKWVRAIQLRTQKLLAKPARQAGIQQSISQLLIVVLVLIMLLVGAWAVRIATQPAQPQTPKMQTAFSSALFAFKKGNYDEAIRLWKAIPLEHRQYLTSNIYLAESYLNLGQADSALVTLTKIAPQLQGSQKSEADQLKARAYIIKGDKARAIQTLEGVIARKDSMRTQAENLLRKIQ